MISGARARRSPYFNLVELDERGVIHLSKPPKKRIERRQDSPKCYDLNASIYVWKRQSLFSGYDIMFGNNSLLFIMPEERSIDIDSELDFQFVEYLMSRREPEA